MRYRIPHAVTRSLLVAALVSACSGSAGPSGPSASVPGKASPPAPPLACETEGYPCSPADVSPDVRARSDELAGAGLEQISGGQSVAATAAWLEGQDGVVSVESDDDTIRFRVDGGRPTWILPDEEAPATGRATSSAPRRQPRIAARDEARTFYSLRNVPTRVVGTDAEAKTAIVLDFFAWFRTGSAPGVAEILGRTRGYEGRVEYLKNSSRWERAASWDKLQFLSGFDVVFIDSIGGQVCNPRCRALIAIHPAGENEAAPDVIGVESAATKDFGPMYGVSADFFLHAYGGNALEDALIVLDVQDIRDVELQSALVSETSTYLHWEGGLIPEDWRAERMVKAIDALATTGRDAFTQIQIIGKDEFTYPPTGAVLQGLAQPGGVNRVREIVWLRDPDTGEALDATSELRVLGTPGDGEPDTVRFLVDVDGMTEEHAAEANLNIMIDNTQAEPLLVNSGRQQSDHMWQVGGQYQLPWDLEEGKKVRIAAHVQLPEGGISTHALELPVAAVTAPDLGNVWEGTANSVEETLWPGITITRTATVQFTRDPSNPPGAKQVSFYLSGGEMTWQIVGASECTPFAPPTTVPIVADEYSYLMFDLDEGDGVTYWGHASVEGPTVDVKVICKDGRSFTYGTGAEGTFFSIPSDEQHGFQGGSTLTGEYVFPSKIPTTYTWELTKVK